MKLSIFFSLDKFQPPLLLAKVANYVATNYNLEERITEHENNQYDYGKLGLELASLMSAVGNYFWRHIRY